MQRNKLNVKKFANSCVLLNLSYADTNILYAKMQFELRALNEKRQLNINSFVVLVSNT